MGLSRKIADFLLTQVQNQDDLTNEIKMIVLFVFKQKFFNLDERNPEIDNLEKSLNNLIIEVLLKFVECENLRNLIKNNDMSVLEKDFIKTQNNFFVILNFLQLRPSKEFFYLIVENFLKFDKKKWILIMMNIGIFNSHGEENQKVEDLLKYHPLYYIYFYQSSKDIKFLDKYLTFFEENDEETSILMMKLLLSKKLYVETLKMEDFSRYFDFIIQRVISKHSSDFFESKDLIENQQLPKNKLILNSNDLETINDKCWFGQSFCEVYLENIIKLIEMNEYYDAAKLNYNFQNKTKDFRKISLDKMIIELINFLQTVEKRKEKLKLSQILEKNLKKSLDILKKI